MRCARCGAALVEVLVATILGAVVVASTALLLQAQSRIARAVTTSSERTDAARSALLTLAAEWRAHVPSTDIYAISSDSAVGRIFRGMAVVCAAAPPRTVVRYRGLRLPDPAKDSALQLGTDSGIPISPFVPDTGCIAAPGEQVLAATWPASAPSGSMWLIFESGGYYLSTHALRYRRGTEPRQPITNQVLADGSSSFTVRADTAMRGIDIRLQDRWSARVATAFISLLNMR